MWIILAFASAVFAGLTSILAKIGVRNTDSHLATALRTVVVLIFSWVMVFITGSHAAIGAIDGRSLLFLILSGLATGGSWLCFFKALQLGDVNKVVPIDKSSTVLTMIFAVVFLGDSVYPLKIVCIALICAGTFLMLEKKKDSQSSPAASGRAPTWLLYAIASAVFASLTSILGKVGIQNVESNLGVAIRTAVVLVMAWAIVFITGKQKQIAAVDRRSWIFIALSGIATGLSWLCYYKALQDGLVSVVVPIDKLSLLVTAGFAVFVLREKMRAKAVIGLTLITAGTLLLLM